MKPLAQNALIQNRYLVVQMIGKGGMGEVYLAVDQRLGSAVALKRTFFNEDNTLSSAFEREAKILARLRHPVLPKVIDHFAENDDQFLVMEHISGDDLAKRLEIAQKPFPLSWVMFWADQLLDALGYLHSHEPPIIHRDIKPENLKLTDENHIVLLDFGLSKDFDSRLPSEPSGTPSVMGYSPHYASMEQIRGSGTDARSDIFSLSATLYQMMTNTVPPAALTRADALLGGGKDPIVPLYALNSEIPTAISDVIIKGMAVRQEERFATAAEMQKSLRRAFNKGDSPSAAQTDVSAGDTQTESEVPTQTHLETGATAMESTLPMDAGEANENVKQSSIKTEVFAAGDLQAQEVKNEAPTRQIDNAEAASPVAGASAAQTPPAFQPKAIDMQQRKRSSSKIGLVIGGLFALLVLAVAGVGGGWYVYTNYYSSAKVSGSPTPSVEVSPSPTATVLADANQNANSATAAVDNSNTADSNSNTAVVTTQTPGGTTTTRPTPQIPTRNTPARTSQTPTAKATPKPKGRDERTVILQ